MVLLRQLLLKVAFLLALCSTANAQQINKIPTDSILGRDTAGAGPIEIITLGTGLGFSGSKTFGITDAELTCLAGLTSAADKFPYFTGSGTCALADISSAERSFLTTPSVSNFAAVLSDEAAGWANWQTTPTSANLATYMTDEAFSLADIELGAIAGLTSAADKLPYFTGSGTAALADLSSAMRTWFTTSSCANLASVTTDETFNCADAELGALSGLASAADKAPYFTGSGTASLFDMSSAMRTWHTTSSVANLASVLTDEAAGWGNLQTTPTSANLATFITDDAFSLSDIELGALSGLTSAADKAPYFTGSGTAALFDMSSSMRTWHTTSSLANLASVLTDEASGWATFNATPSSANLKTFITDETGSGGALVFATGPTISGLIATGTTDIQQNVQLSGDISPTQLAADTNDWAPTGLSTAGVIRASTDASRNLTGLTGGADGRLIVLNNIGSNNLVLKDESASSTAANRFALNADITLGADTSVWLLYDSTSSRWRAIGGTGSGSGSGQAYTASSSAPGSPTAGDIWLDTDTLIQYRYVNDGDSSQWTELGPATGNGGLVLLTSGVIANGATTLDIVLTSYTQFRGLKFVLTGVTLSAANYQYIRLSTNGGSSYDSGATNYGYGTVYSDASSGGDNGDAGYGSGTGSSSILYGYGGSGTSHALNTEVFLPNPTNTAAYPTVSFHSVATSSDNSDTYVFNITGGGARLSAQDTDAIRFLPGSGTYTGGSYAVYGYN